MAIPHAKEPLGVLLIEDDDAFRAYVEELLCVASQGSFRVVAGAGTLARGLDLLDCAAVNVVLLDLSLPDSKGIDTFIAVHDRAPRLPIIVLSGNEEEELALRTVHLGAQEFLLKGNFNAQLLVRTLRYTLERAHAEAALAQERDLLSTLLENIPDRIYFKDESSRFIRVNRAMVDLFGLKSAEDLYGKTDADFFGAERAQETLQDERQVMRTGEPIAGKVEKKEVVSSGRRTWTLTTKLPLRDHNGRIVGTCGISREITRLKEMEERLNTERNLLRSVIDNLPDHIFLKDAAGRYLLANAAYLQWLGASDSSEVIGRTVHDFYPPKIADRLLVGEEEVFQRHRPLLDHEARLPDPKGNERWALMTKTPWYDETGAILGLVCISRDVTDKKLAGERLERAYAETAKSREEVMAAMTKLQSAHRELRQVQLQLIEAEKMKTVGRLAAGVAHEVKNPLAVIKMGLEYLGVVSKEDDNAAFILAQMSEAVQRADNVIRGLLDFSAPTRLELHPESLNLVIEDALRHVQTEFPGSFQVVRELQSELPEVPIDAAKFGQVFVNLFTNSVHAMEGRGTLVARTYSRQLTGIGPNVANSATAFRVGETIVVAEIEDTGPGVPEDKLGKIFEPFFTTKPTGKGTGLGLSVVKTIVDLHGGAVDLKNIAGGGLRVTITLRT